MAGDMVSYRRIKQDKLTGNRNQLLILRVGIGQRIGPFQLNTDGKIVATFSAAVAGNARVPGTLTNGV